MSFICIWQLVCHFHEIFLKVFSNNKRKLPTNNQTLERERLKDKEVWQYHQCYGGCGCKRAYLRLASQTKQMLEKVFFLSGKSNITHLLQLLFDT